MTWYIHPSKQLRDDELPPELVVTNRDGSIEQAYVPETRLYSLEERATCNAWTIRLLKGDNAKLRELVRIAVKYCDSGTCDGCPILGEDESCPYSDMARELGVEVDE